MEYPTAPWHRTYQFSCNTLPRPWYNPTGRWVEAGGAPPAQVGLQGLGQGLAQGPGVAGSSGSSRRPRQHWGLQLLQQLCLQEEMSVEGGHSSWSDVTPKSPTRY